MAGLLRLEKAIGTIDGVNRDFAAPTAYISGTVYHLRNGVPIDRDADNGLEELDPSAGTVRLKVAPLPASGARAPAAGDMGDVVFLLYQTPLNLTGGGAEGGVPKMRAANLILAKPFSAGELLPKMTGAADGTPKPPKMTGAPEAAPETKAAVDIRPKMISAKEEP